MSLIQISIAREELSVLKTVVGDARFEDPRFQVSLLSKSNAVKRNSQDVVKTNRT